MLAHWLQQHPSDSELAVWTRQERTRLCLLYRLLDWIWPICEAVRAVDTEEEVYPHVLVAEWIAQEGRGTDALKHERLIITVGWFLYVALLLKTTL